MFGVNQRGQCGVNEAQTNHVWDPTPIVVSDSEKLSYEPKFESVALGLQHGLAIDTNGSLFSWGKANRGQLGLRKNLIGAAVPTDTQKSKNSWFDPADISSCEVAALRITEFHRLESVHGKEMIIPASHVRVTKVSAGFNHSAAVTEENQAWVWGKNTKSFSTSDSIAISKVALDSQVPISIQGLPSNTAIIDISCGSHHTSILMEDGSVFAIGIATDTLNILHDAVQIVPPGLIQQPILQFSSHFDRTTIVHGQGLVMEVHLWEDLRSDGVFEPAWVQNLGSPSVKMVHRGWLHTIVVTND
jgi:alpha-tubulin suppressor-like RCC1 family protein